MFHNGMCWNRKRIGKRSKCDMLTLDDIGVFESETQILVRCRLKVQVLSK